MVSAKTKLKVGQVFVFIGYDRETLVIFFPEFYRELVEDF